MSEHWCFFVARQGEPRAVLMDLGLADDVPLAGLPFLGRIHFQLRDPHHGGIPSPDEHERLSEVEEAVASSFEGHEFGLYVGRETTDTLRAYYFYTSSPDRFESRARAALTGFSEYAFAIDSRKEARWSTDGWETAVIRDA